MIVIINKNICLQYHFSIKNCVQSYLGSKINQ